MTEKDIDRTADARAHDDHELIDAATRAPSQSGRGGGPLGPDIGTRDDMKRATDPDAPTTGVEKADKRHQPFIATRADNDGANG